MTVRSLPRLILGSASPRRAALLRQLGLEFERLVCPDDEPDVGGSEPAEHALGAARAKARAVARLARERGRRRGAIVIGADTVVCVGRVVLGKPADPADAARMLRLLSGRSHQVYTGVVLVTEDDRELEDCSVTRVHMRALSEADVRAYVHSREPLDKAGAYGIQGLGARFIEHIEGCYYNVVGLPLARLSALLEEAGYDFSATIRDER